MTTSTLPPQVLLSFNHDAVLQIDEPGAGKRTYLAGARHFVKLPAARELVVSGAAVPVEPLQAVGMSDAPSVVAGWLREKETPSDGPAYAPGAAAEHPEA